MRPHLIDVEARPSARELCRVLQERGSTEGGYLSISVLAASYRGPASYRGEDTAAFDRLFDNIGLLSIV
jgi:hypothetical protein